MLRNVYEQNERTFNGHGELRQHVPLNSEACVRLRAPRLGAEPVRAEPELRGERQGEAGHTAAGRVPERRDLHAIRVAHGEPYIDLRLQSNNWKGGGQVPDDEGAREEVYLSKSRN